MEPSVGARDAPCPSCGHLLWFTEVVPGATNLQKLKDELNSSLKLRKETVMKLATKRFGLPTDKMKASLNAVHSGKFEKIEWKRLLEAQCTSDRWGLLPLIG